VLVVCLEECQEHQEQAELPEPEVLGVLQEQEQEALEVKLNQIHLVVLEEWTQL
jgi:hypothetical protein